MYYYIGNKRLFDTDKIKWCSIEDSLLYLNSLDEIGVDTETTGFDPHTSRLLSIQLGDGINQYFINLSEVPIDNYLNLFKTDKLFILQNARFDLRFLLHKNITLNNIYDTFLAECILTTGYEEHEREVNLKALGKKYCNIELDKSIRGQIHKGITDAVIEYGCNDVKYLIDIKNKQLELITKYDLTNVLNLENNVVKVFAKIEYNGIGFNSTNWKQIANLTKKQVESLETKLNSIILNSPLSKKYKTIVQGNLFFEDASKATTINWSSPSQKLKILKELGIKITSTSDKDLQFNKSKHEIIPLLIEFSKANKLVSSFGDSFLKFINPVTNRIHPEIWQILSTGRISMSNPNIQQIPSHGELAKTIRSSFIPREGYKMVGGDYSGFELSIIAEFSRDPIWMNTLNTGGNLHSVLCAMTFDIPECDVKKPFPAKPSFSYRDVQKIIDFGLAYGMSKYKLADTLQISPEEAEKVIKKFFSRVPHVEKFLNHLGNLGKQRGYISTPAPFKRTRWFPKWKGDATDFNVLGSIERASKNAPIQGTNANCIKYALVTLQDIIDKNNYPVNILMTIHDEIQTECKEEFTDEWIIILKNVMLKCAGDILKNVKVDADCKISDYWVK